MMSLIDLDDEQRWVPTHVNVTVLRARGLRTKGKAGSRYLYAVVQVGRDKRTTGLVERTAEPCWDEECCFELLPGMLEEEGGYPSDLVLTVMHRVLIGMDVFLGQACLPLDGMFRDGTCPRDEWMKLNSKSGRKEKERGELQVTVQFTRNNMTASMFDLTIKDKPRSAFGKLKDRVTGRKRGDVESSSAILPGRYAALSGNLGQPSEEGGGVELGDAEVVEEKRSKVKDFFKGKLRRSSDTRSCSSLASESSVSSLASDNLGPPPSLDLLADPPSSPIYTSKVRVDTHYGETDLAKKVLTSQHTTKVLTHKRAFSDEASKITTSFSRTSPAVEALKGQTMTQSKSSLCINGSHVYDSEPSTPRGSAALPSKLVLLEKCSPLSRSLQNLTKRSDSAISPGESRRWSFDKVKKEEKEEEKEPESAALVIQSARTGGRPVQAATPIVYSATASPDKVKKQKKALFSGGRSDSLPAKSDQGQAVQAAEGRLRGWFGSTDTQNKPRLEVSTKVESSTDVPPPLPPRSPIPHQFQFPFPSASPTGLVSPDNESHSSPFSATSSPSSTPISTSNPFLTHMQRNPFFDELIAEELCKSPPLVPRSPSVSASSLSPPCNPNPSNDAKPKKTASTRRERPRPVARQISLPALLPKSAIPCSPNHCAPRSMSESKEECDDFFDAFASSRLNSPKGPLPQKVFQAIPSQPHRSSKAFLNSHSFNTIEEQKAGEVQPPPLPPRRLLRTPVNEVYTDTWLHRGQQLAVQHEACLLSQTGAASLLHGREAEHKRNMQSISPDHLTTSETSDSLSVRTSPYENSTSPAFKSEENLKKFKYEPLEDETDRWRGMLFEQDLYGRVGIGNCSEPKVSSALSSVAPKDDHLEINDWIEDKVCLDEKMMVSDVLGSLSTTVTKSKMMAIGDTSTILQSTIYTSPGPQVQPLCTNNNISHSLTLEDLNMNVNDSDFTFIDSEGSSPSDIGDTVQNLKGLDTVFPQPSEDILLANYHVEMNMPDHTFSLNKTNTIQNNISLETSTLSNELLMVFPVGEGEECEFRNTILQNICEVGSLEILASAQADVESKQDTTKDALNKTLDEDLDDNGNLQTSLVTPNKKDSSSSSSSRVVSARLRPNRMRCPANQSIQGEASEQLSREPSKSHQVFPLATEDMSDFNEINVKSWTSSKAHPNAMAITHTQQCTTEGTKSSFADLHAKVAPAKTTLSNSKIPQSSQGSKPSPSLSSAVSMPAGPPNTLTDASCLSIHPLRTFPSTASNSTLAVAPFTSFPSFSSPSPTVQPLIDAPHTLLPEEIDPACNLPHQESSPHPVKPLNSTASQSDKKEGRSVLEKLKSTIHPGRTASQSASEPERSPLVSVDTSAQYQQLSNMELIALLLQQEMDMQKQQAASEQQGALLDKREAELKKLKMQVRDLEDYIDNLLLRIMEQTPTLLQVRARHK